jgi:UDP-2,3-diacylglucosamine pyrophosphatase LpxH
MWVSESEGENIAENRVRILLNGLCIVDTVEDLIDYKFKSINYIYLVKKLTSESLIENVLYKFYGCSDNDTLVYTDMEEDPYIYRGKNKEDKIFDYYKTKAELISSIGQLKSMVPVFLRQTTKESVVDSSTGEVTGYQLRNQTIAPYTMGSYVFLSNGDTVEEVCSQISKFHKRNTIVTVNSDLVTLKTYTDWNEHTTVGTLIVPFTVPVDNFFEYTSNSTSSTDEIESDYMDVYIGSTYISQDRYKMTIILV